MTRPSRFALVLCVMALGSPAAVARQEAAPARGTRGVLAVVRQDGLLIPFASVDGDRWLAPWPVSLRTLDVPVTLAGIPKPWWGRRAPGSWRFHGLDGTIEPIALDAPVVYPVGCERRLGVRTDRQPAPLVAPAAGPFPKIGLAASDGLAIGRIETVDRGNGRYADLAVSLLPVFDRAEDRAVGMLDDFARWKHPLPAGWRRRVPVRIEAWYRSPMAGAGASVSYIEAVRSYPPRPQDEGCGLETFFSGWFQFEPGVGRPIPTDVRARVTYCDRSTALYMLPFGTLQTAKRLFWIFQLSGWDQEWYEVVEISPNRTGYVVEYYGGGECRREIH